MQYEVCSHPDLNRMNTLKILDNLIQNQNCAFCHLFRITQGLLILCGHCCCSTEEGNSEMLSQRFRLVKCIDITQKLLKISQ